MFTRALVTGGAGFIGSHLIDKLCEGGFDVVALDNLSSGRIENLRRWMNSPYFTFVKADLLDINEAILNVIRGCDIIFHLAANPEVRVGLTSPRVHYELNVATTFNLLECIRRVEGLRMMIFTSSSTVYGEPSIIPTPEDAPLKPISIYGASKMASEALIMSYAYTYGFNAIIYRLANVVGPRSRHGVLYDFIKKLLEDSEKLEILGNGMQRKSYVYIDDCIEAMLFCMNKSQEGVNVYNIGSEDQVSVREIADIVCEEMKIENVKYFFTGGVNGGRGWVGDVKNMLLSIERIKKLGWSPRLNSKQAVREAIKAILMESEEFKIDVS